jgi:hypothetical protein
MGLRAAEGRIWKCEEERGKAGEDQSSDNALGGNVSNISNTPNGPNECPNRQSARSLMAICERGYDKKVPRDICRFGILFGMFRSLECSEVWHL